ncbi:sterol desaturase family protein [Teredinibacter waterburyi]|uniref:sterol desaturase family protein n=1 Tax=Teredinibacter waterburyi TaxID=1500538 RepID=UPI00165F606A|nr:sterol desaturase family protein [Teredinibacter waterburyi]
MNNYYAPTSTGTSDTERFTAAISAVISKIWSFDLKKSDAKFGRYLVYSAIGISFIFWLLGTVKIQHIGDSISSSSILIFHMVPEIPFDNISPNLVGALILLSFLRVISGFAIGMLDIKYFSKMTGKPFDWKGMVNISCSNILIYIFALSFFLLTPVSTNFLGYYHSFVEQIPTLLNVNGAIAVVAACIIGDLCFYWSHRLTHNVRILWNLGHINHHRHENLTQFHFAAEPDTLFLRASNIAYLLILPIISKLFTTDMSAVGWSLVVMMILDIITDPSHSPFLYYLENKYKWLRLLRKVFVTASVHYTHHSREVTHNKKTGCNFAARFTFWDRIFGTYVEPSEHLPETGLFGKHTDYCNNPVRFLLLPYYRFYLELKRNKLRYWLPILFATTRYAPPNKARISH